MFAHSTAVDSKSYETEGLCEGIEVRTSSYTHLEDRGAIRAHQDWNKYYLNACPIGLRLYHMQMNLLSYMTVSVMAFIFTNHLTNHNIDVTDQVDFERGEAENDEMMNAFLEAAHTGSIKSSVSEIARAGKKKIQSQLFLEMLSIDPECAKTTMKAWARFVEVGSSRKHDTCFQTLAEYLPYRIMDVGEMFWYGVVTFGLGLRILEHETDIC
ncbi:fusicoccadiene synthase [Colletotrichum liriopes]|uniref:Fusicoccadiene synthase n=1 Tax=Colletotrichum liriopes TaxID=708192 RepID=A0AA37GDJ2_9PEZI|nr:fusicoccadiene synthase [Colletotrichum liriopes]